MLCVCQTFPKTNQSQDARSGDLESLSKKNSCMNLQKGTRVKLTQKIILFYLPLSILDFKMSSSNGKLDSAGKWHKRLGQMNPADVVRNAPDTVGNSMMYAICEHCPRSQGRQYQE